MSAFVEENQITLGEVVVDEKGNEITAVPALLDLIDVEECTVTTDTMSCQKEITKKITEKKADYVVSLKENQSAMYQDVNLYFQSMTDGLFSCETWKKITVGLKEGHIRLPRKLNSNIKINDHFYSYSSRKI